MPNYHDLLINLGKRFTTPKDTCQVFKSPLGKYVLFSSGYLNREGIDKDENDDALTSTLVCQDLKNYILENPHQKISEQFRDALLYAREELKTTYRANEWYFGNSMALISLLVRDKLYYLNIGNCRIYSLKNNKLRVITEDASSMDSLKTKPMGISTKRIPEIQSYNLSPGEKLFYCSKELYQLLSDEEIRDSLDNRPLRDAGIDPWKKSLMSTAEANGARDGFSALLINHVGDN